MASTTVSPADPVLIFARWKCFLQGQSQGMPPGLRLSSIRCDMVPSSTPSHSHVGVWQRISRAVMVSHRRGLWMKPRCPKSLLRG